MLMRRPDRRDRPLTPHRRRVLLIVAVCTAVLVAAGLVTGLVYAIGYHGSPTRPAAASTAAPGPAPATSAVTAPGMSDQQREDVLAAAAMASLPAAAANPHPLAAKAVKPFKLPTAHGTRGTVAAGFPHTTAGAVAQFAAIDQAALAGMNPAQVAQVYADWAAPGAEPLATWSVNAFVTQVLGASGIPNGSSQLTATYAVTEAQVKGTVGDDFVLACINGEFDAALADNPTRIGAADCARMVWTGGRWQIGPGTQPASPPNAWPGTVDAQQAGWRPVTHS